MVRLALHTEKLDDIEFQERKLGERFSKIRGDHLDCLAPLVEAFREKSPVPASYDVARAQPPYFNEFTLTEFMGLLYVAPQSSELAARVMDYAAKHPTDDRFDVSAMVSLKDKYKLDEFEPDDMPERIAFLPGSNIFATATSKEMLDRDMHRYPDMMLKPHPMTHDDTIRQLGINYGYHRILEPMDSAATYLAAAKVIYALSSSELGIYGFLMGKDVRNLTRTSFEAMGVYNPIYRLLWDEPDPAAMIKHLLNSPFSGIYHPDDPNALAKMDEYLRVSFELREVFRPLVREYDPLEYSAMVRPNTIARVDSQTTPK